MVLTEPGWDQAREAMASARSLPAVNLPLHKCDGLVLAADLTARSDLPAFDTSAMDGWAVRGTGPWQVVGTSLAGRPWPARLQQGQAVIIATGAAVPGGATAVVRSEEGTLESQRLHAGEPLGRAHIRPAGEECHRGDLLAPAGAEVNPALIGLAAAAGWDELAVVRRPRGALVVLGDELAHSGVPAGGRVRDSLGPQVPAWLARMGVDVLDVTTAEDRLADHVTAISRAASIADVVLTTGGTAAGPVDHVRAALAGRGELVVDRVAVRPGHPMLAAMLGEGTAWLLGLPGNPLSAIVTLMTLGLPLLDALSGRPRTQLAQVAAGEAMSAPARETRLVPGRLAGESFHPAGHLGSGMLRGLAASTGFAVLPPGGVPAGAAVRWLPLPPLGGP